MQEVPGSIPIGDIAFFRGKTYSNVTLAFHCIFRQVKHALLLQITMRAKRALYAYGNE
jgi:hypothetical protein